MARPRKAPESRFSCAMYFTAEAKEVMDRIIARETLKGKKITRSDIVIAAEKADLKFE